MIFGKFVTKNRAFGNTTIFYNNFFRLGRIPPPPKSASGIEICLEKLEICI